MMPIAGFDPTKSISLIQASCNLATIADGRGGVFTWADLPPIAEVNYIFTRAGERRGFHLHTEFNEWVMVTSGEGVYMQWRPQNDPELGGDGQYPFIQVYPGSVIQFPIGVPHTLSALTEMRMVAMLDKKWDDCEKPITRVEEVVAELQTSKYRSDI